MKRNPVKLIYSSSECEEVESIILKILIKTIKARVMNGKWNNNSFTTLETRALVDAINMYKRKLPLEW